MAPALEINIPNTSIDKQPDGKPYTVYNVTLHLPLRKHELRKRYNDFVALNNDLTSQTGAAPPAPLPAKSWLRKTINSEALTEERRQALQRYLVAIVEADDARWRSSSVWRAFLNLPSGTNTVNANGSLSTATAMQRRRASVDTAVADPNAWLDLHRELKSHIQTARSLLKQREAASLAKDQHALGADAKAALVRAAAAIAQLDDGLKRIAAAAKGDSSGWAGPNNRLGEGEIRRRRDLLGAARNEVEGLEGVLRSLATRTSGTSSSSAMQVGGTAAASEADKAGLWKGTSASKPKGRVLGGPMKETERTRELDNSGVLQLQKQIMQDQDEDVMDLGKTVSRLKDMGILINEELAIQNEMLGLVDQDVDRLQGKIDVARSRIKKIR